MKSLLGIASLLDKSGQFSLSDKLFRIAQVSSPVLDSDNASVFVSNLFNYAKQNNLSNIADAFDSYADAGARFGGQSIKQNPVLQKLYSVVANTPRAITQQELVGQFNNLMSNSQDVVYTGQNSYIGKMPGLMQEPNNPSSYVDYATYLQETGQKRKSPIGTNNDDQIREKDYLKNQGQIYNQWLDDIKVYADSNNIDQLEGLKSSIRDDVNLTSVSKNKLYGIINYYKGLISK